MTTGQAGASAMGVWGEGQNVELGAGAALPAGVCLRATAHAVCRPAVLDWTVRYSASATQWAVAGSRPHPPVNPSSTSAGMVCSFRPSAA
jgi:hypothetical protein